VLLRPRRCAVQHQGDQVVLLDPSVELIRLRFNLATTAVGFKSGGWFAGKRAWGGVLI
jgi:hypothetical protein